MDAREYFDLMSDDDLLALADEVAGDLFAYGAIASSTKDPDDIRAAEIVYTACNVIHDELTRRDFRIEARMMFARVNRTVQMITGREIMSDAEYREHYPRNI